MSSNSISSTLSSSSSLDEDPNMQYKIVYEKFVKAATLYIKNQIDEAETSSRSRKTRKVVNRQRDEAHLRLMKDYFDEDCVFDEGVFR